MAFKLDLSKFKRTGGDAKHVVMTHEDGHSMKIALNPLHPKMRKELQALPLHKAEGGNIPQDEQTNQDPGYMDYLNYLAQKASANLQVSGQMVNNQTQLAQQQAHNPNMQLTPEQQAEQQKYFENVAGGVAGSMAPVKEVAVAAELATPERQALNAAYENVPKGYAPEAADTLGRAADANSRAIARKELFQSQLKARRGYADGGMLDGIKDNDLVKQSGQKRKMADGGNVADSAEQIASDAAAQQPQEQMPAQNATPAQQPNDYAKIYDEIYAQQKLNNPGQPDQMVRNTALDTAVHAKKGDEIKQQVSELNQQQSQQQAIQAQEAENQKRAMIGLPPIGNAQQPPQGAEQGGLGGPANSPQQAQPEQQNSFMGNMQQAYNLQKQGIEEGAKAIGDLGQARSDVLAKQTTQEAENLANMQASQHRAMSEHEALLHDVQKGYVNPNRFMENQSTPQKVSTAIGLLLGGIGGAITHQENPALKFLNDQINRDVQAQATNLQGKNNLLAHNIQMLNSVQDGYRLTQSQITSMYAHQIDQAAAKAMTPQAKAAADEAKGKLLGQSAMFLGQIGQPGQGGQGNSMDNYLNMMRMVNPERAKEIESRYVPGMGVASVPISEDARKSLIGKQQLAEAAKDMYDWATKHSGSINPADINLGKTKAANLQNLYRGAINGGVYKKGEQDFIDNIVDSDPTKFFNNVRVLPKLREVMNQNQISANALKRSYGMSGLPGQASSSSPSGFQPKSFRPVK